MAGERIVIHMSGGGPWGFRLYGGESDPLVIAKLRKHSKAADAGIYEGDVLLGINTYSCKGLNHPTAMSLVEQAGNELTFQILRGSIDKQAIDMAYQALESNLQPLPTTQLAPKSTTFNNDTTQPIPSQEGHILNGHGDSEVKDVKSLSQMFQQGDQTKRVTTQTSQHQIGTTTITKVQREEITHSGVGPGLSSYPIQEKRSVSPYRPAMFNVSNSLASGAKPTGLWKPTGQAHTAPLVVSASGGVNLEHNKDSSVTMSFGIGESKENIAPAYNTQYQLKNPVAAFNVKKVDSTTQGKWIPGNIPSRATAPPPHRFTPEHDVQDRYDSSFDKMDSSIDMVAPFVQTDESKMNIHLSKILYECPGSDDSGNESPGTFWMRKKKIFADSSFYDDPQHRYPTIEEQIKMARKVALSLIAPANRNARGHRMFVKRKQKAIKWTTGMEPMEIEVTSDEEDEKYFNPNPWCKTASHTWQPPSKQTYQLPQQPYMQYKPPVSNIAVAVPIPPPPPPPPPKQMESFWKSKPIRSVESDMNKALSAGDFENFRLHGQKTKHTNMPPQMAFSLAADMKKMKGKGGRLFAKRRERAEKWVVGETFGQADADPNIMEKLVMCAQRDNMGMSGSAGQSQGSHGYIPPATFNGGMPVNRLSELINPPKPTMSPWDACADFGDVDKAFDHLDGYIAMKRGNYKSAVAQNLDKAAQRSYMTPFRPGMTGVPVNVLTTQSMTDYKMKPWQSTASTPNLSTSTTFVNSQPTPIAPPKINVKSDVQMNAPSTTKANAWSKSGTSDDIGLYFPSEGDLRRIPVAQPCLFNPESAASFRPVEFKPSGNPTGIYETSALSSTTGARGGSVKDINEEEGFCDL